MAANYTWDAGAATTDWLTAQNWSADLLPTAADNALINMASGVTLTGPGALVSQVQIGTTNGGIGNLTISNSAAITANMLVGNAAGSTGTLTVNTGQLTSPGDMRVGNGGNGTMRVQNGGVVQTGGIGYVAFAAASNSSVTIEDANSQWNVSGSTRIGQSGTAGLTVQNGGTVNGTGYVAIGAGATSTGTGTVTGANSLINTNSALYVGASGTGTLNVQNGGTASGTTSIRLGDVAGSSGTATIDGSNSLLTTPGILYIGQAGAGTLNVQNGGKAKSAANVVTLGDAAGSSGTATVTGANSELTSGAAFYIGNAGTGTLNVQNSGSVSSVGAMSLGRMGGSTGTATIDGAGSNLSVSNILYIGSGGSGTLNVQNGATASNTGTLRIGNSAGSTGIATITGTNSNLTSSGTLYVGNEGTGTLNIQNGGAVSSAVTIRIGEAVTTGIGTVTVNGTNSILTSSGIMYVGNAGTGTLNVQNGAKARSTANSVSIGHAATGSGTVTVDGVGSELTAAVTLNVGNLGTGTLTVQNGGTATAVDSIYIGTLAGANSTTTITGAGSKLQSAGVLFLGHNGTGILNIENGGKIEVSQMRLGSAANGDGTLNITNGGILNTIGRGYLGYVGNTNTTANISGAGSQWNLGAANLYISEAAITTASVTISNGGQVNNFSGVIGNDAGSDGALTVTGAGSLWNNTASAYVGYSGVGTLTISNGGQVKSDIGIVGYLTGSNGTALINGAGSSWDNRFVVIGGAAAGTATLSDGGRISASESITIGNNATSTGVLNIGASSVNPAAAAGALDTKNIIFGTGTGTIVFNHTDLNYIVSSNISGNGTLNFLAGTTKLTGDNTGFTGRVLGNSAVEVTSGITDIDSNSAAFAGTTDIVGGVLRVNGSLGGTTTISGTGRLQGNGTLTDLIVDNGGTVAPGNSIGTTNVVNAIFNPGSVYEVEVNAAGQSDLIDATGTATLNGGTVRAIAFPDYRVDQPYTILTAALGVAGTFDNATDDFLFLDSSLTYDANNAYLTLTRSGPNMESMARTRNQKSVAGVIDGGNINNAGVAALVASQTQEELWLGLDALSGEIHASMAGALIRGQAVLQNPGKDADESRVYGSGKMWLRSYGRFGYVQDVFGTASVDQNDVGVLAGVERDLDDESSLGFGFGASRTGIDANARNSEADSNNYHALIYAGKEIGGGVTLNGGASYTFHQIQTGRSIAIGPFSGESDVDYDAHTSQLYAGIGRRYRIEEKSVVEPYIQGTMLYQRSGSFREDGAAGLKADSQSYAIGLAEMGVRLQHKLPIGAGTSSVIIDGEAGYRRAIGQSTPSRDLAFNDGGGAFTVEGAPIDQNSIIVGTGLTVDLGASLDFRAGYRGDLAPDSRTHEISARFNIEF